MSSFMKIFIFTSIPFGFFMMLMFGWLFGIIGGLIFGLLMAGILSVISEAKTGSIKGEPDYDSSSVNQTTTISIIGQYNEVFNACLESKYLFPGAKINVNNKEGGNIKFSTKSSLSSWGEAVSIQCKEFGNKINVTINSKPELATTLVDYGINYQNISKIKKYLISKKFTERPILNSIPQKLREYAKLKDEGVISEEEFQRKKDHLLSKDN